MITDSVEKARQQPKPHPELCDPSGCSVRFWRARLAATARHDLKAFRRRVAAYRTQNWRVLGYGRKVSQIVTSTSPYARAKCRYPGQAGLQIRGSARACAIWGDRRLLECRCDPVICCRRRIRRNQALALGRMLTISYQRRKCTQASGIFKSDQPAKSTAASVVASATVHRSPATNSLSAS